MGYTDSVLADTGSTAANMTDTVPFLLDLLLGQWFSTRGDFTLQEIFGNISPFWPLQFEGCFWH